MYVLVLVEHGVKLRIARQRAAARRGVRRCRHFWMSAPRNSARQAARRTPRRRTPPAPSEKQERLWTWHSFTISFVGFEKEGGKAVAAVFSAAQWDKNVIFLLKIFILYLKKNWHISWSIAILIWKIVDSNHGWSKDPYMNDIDTEISGTACPWAYWAYSWYISSSSAGPNGQLCCLHNFKIFWPMKASYTSNEMT